MTRADLVHAAEPRWPAAATPLTTHAGPGRGQHHVFHVSDAKLVAFARWADGAETQRPGDTPANGAINFANQDHEDLPHVGPAPATVAGAFSAATGAVTTTILGSSTALAWTPWRAERDKLRLARQCWPYAV
jgi:hypothetical protein